LEFRRVLFRSRSAQLQGTQLVLVGQLMQLENQRQSQSRFEIRQVDRQLAGRHGAGQQQAPTAVAQAIEQVEQALFPVAAARHSIEIVKTDQLAQFEVVEQLRAVLHHLTERQIDHCLAPLLETQAGRL